MIKKYKIRELSLILGKEGTEKAGQPLGKKMVLKADDDQNEEPRVTVWNDHPECENAALGSYISGHLDKKDSGTPIPGRSGNFVNRTLYATELNDNGTEKPQGNPALEATVASLVTWAKTKGYGVNSNVEGVDYPEGEIDPDSIPF